MYSDSQAIRRFSLFNFIHSYIGKQFVVKLRQKRHKSIAVLSYFWSLSLSFSSTSRFYELLFGICKCLNKCEGVWKIGNLKQQSKLKLINFLLAEEEKRQALRGWERETAFNKLHQNCLAYVFQSKTVECRGFNDLVNN